MDEVNSKIKVVVIMPHLLHYFNLILNKVNEIPEVDVTVIIPHDINPMTAGGGINQTIENVHFDIVNMTEFKFGPYYTYKSLIPFLIKTKPNIIITGDIFMYPFVFNIFLRLVMRFNDIKLIMRSIPYQVRTYQESFYRVVGTKNRIDKLSKPFSFLIKRIGAEYLLRRSRAYMHKVLYNRPDAHLNYIDEAYDIYGSYGVPTERVFVTYNSPDTDSLEISDQATIGLPNILPVCKHRILHVGRLVKWKRVDLLINALTTLNLKFPDVELVIIGEGPEEEELKVLAVKLGVDKQVRFLGGVYDSDILAQYYKSCSLYVLAGVGGLSINDAMFYRLPIICSVCDGTEKKLVREGFNGKYFIENDLDDLTDKITYILQDEQLCLTMGKNSRKIIDEEINIHTVLDKWQAAFRYVLDK